MWRCFILFAQPHPTPPCSSAIYCLAELLEFAAFVWLRVKAPNLHRPYRVPLPTWGLILMLLPASVLLVRAVSLRGRGRGGWHCSWREALLLPVDSIQPGHAPSYSQLPAADHPGHIPCLQITILVIPFAKFDYMTMGATLGAAALGFILWPLLQVRLVILKQGWERLAGWGKA